MKLENRTIYPWVVVALLWVVALLNYMDRQMLSTMRDAMMIDITELESAANFGRLMAIFLWTYGLMSPVAGIIADKISRKWLIVSSLFVWSLVTLLMGYATSFDQLYALRALMGLSEALYIPAGLSLIADFHSNKTRSLAVGIHMTGLYTGQAIGGFGATVAKAYSWEATFHWFGIIGVIYSIILILFLRDKKVVEQPVKTDKPVEKIPIFKGLTMLAANVWFWVILLYFATPSLPGWATKNWLPTLFSSNLSIDMAHAGPMSTITIAVSSFIGVILGGILSDKWVQKNIKGRIYTGAIGLGLTIPSLLFLGFGHNLPMIIGGALCFGFGYGMFDANNMPILCQFVSSKYRGTVYGIMNMTGVFAGAFITNLLGKSTDSGTLGNDFAMLSILVFIVLCVQLLFLKPKVANMEES
ncbi:sugar phosphate permease [Dysgonomonas alginatilytica]|uniref:Sugar phosphate permease n=1 Tax=Dysgonomonas alginatilytica TaxID=1605892 RepID=A0A2V3PU15_9BACT|nr:MFS transporter [Dysgonomonas alginatilytica]PXV66805.1 sugar phosphate permease [Dysgonomonas alginatilytica]